MKMNANLVIYSSLEPEAGDWEPVLPENVPDAIKDPDVIGYMVSGELAKVAGGDLWYKAEKANGL